MDPSPEKPDSANLYLICLGKDLEPRFGDEELKDKGLEKECDSGSTVVKEENSIS